MGLFSFETDEIREQYFALIRTTDGTEPCFDPNLGNPDAEEVVEESVTDLYAENYTSRGMTIKQAQALCAGCHIIEQCAAYAIAAKEPSGVWGGTTPSSRGVKQKYKSNIEEYELEEAA